MNDLTKAQITIGLLACFTLVWGLGQQALTSSDLVYGILILIGQLIAIMILSMAILGILQWTKLFDLKTNAVLTLVAIVTIRLLSGV